MPGRSREAAFATFVRQERPLLQGLAFLGCADTVRAAQLVDATLAHLYDRWAAVTDPRAAALRGVLHLDDGATRLPWQGDDRFELVDQAPAGFAAPVVAGLARLPDEQRAAVLLDRYVGLPRTETARVLQRPLEQVDVLLGQARSALGDRPSPGRTDDALTAALRAAVPTALLAPVPAGPATADVTNGRRLAGRRWRRRGLVAVAAVALVVLTVTQLRPAGPQVEVTAPRTVPTATQTAAVTPACHPRDLDCRANVLGQWRSEMSDVVASYLDPQGRYYDGYSYATDDRFETREFWFGKGGRLALELFRPEQGVTEIYLQIATDYDFATRCGDTTGQDCTSMRLLGGNRYTVSESTNAYQGLEVQYSPAGRQVITVVARNTERGKAWPVDRGTLIELVQDPRLRLPAV